MSSSAEVMIYSMNKKEACLKRKGVGKVFNFSKKNKNSNNKNSKIAVVIYLKVWLGF